MPLDADLNGIWFVIVKEDDPDFDLYYEMFPLGRGWYFMFKTGWDLSSFITAAGHDASKCDYAVPQSWFDTWGKDDAIGKAVWSYEDGSLGGFPITYEQMWLEIKSQLSLRL